MSQLLRLFATQKWTRALRVLTAKRRKLRHKIQKEFSDSSYSSPNMKIKKRCDLDQCTSISNLLPAAIASRAPTYVLNAIIDLNPNILSIPMGYLLSSEENILLLPLQYACSIGASPKTIKTLLSLKDQDCTEQTIPSNGISTSRAVVVSTNHVNDENRTALHYAIHRLTSCCKPTSCQITLGTSSTHQRTTFDEKEMILTVSYLLDAYPDAVLHLDKYNQTPIDMLQEAKCSEKILSRSIEEQELICIVCNILRLKAVQVHRRRKEDWERKGCNSSFLHRNSMKAICNSIQSSTIASMEEETQKSRDEIITCCTSRVVSEEEKHNTNKRIYTVVYVPHLPRKKMLCIQF